MEKEPEKKEPEKKEPETAKRRAVPKFGSFRPKPADPDPDTRPTSGKGGSRRENDEGPAGKTRHDDRRDQDRRRDRDRDRGSDRERERARPKETGRERERESEYPYPAHESGRERRWDRDRDRERDRDRNQEGEGRRVRERERDRKREGDTERDRYRDRHRERPRERAGDDRERHSPESRGPKTIPAPANDLFVLDKRGDPLILQYGTNDRSTIPSYYRFGAGRLIGSSGFLTLHRDGATEQFSIRPHGEGTSSGSAFRDKTLVAATNRLASRRIRPSPDQPPPTASDDFIPLLPSLKRKRSPSPTHHHPSSSASSSPSRSPSLPPSPSPHHREQTTTATLAAALSTHLRAHPTDIPAWHRLIALQPALFSSQQPLHHHRTDGGQQQRTAEETKSLAELKVGLYQQALGHAADPADREALVLGMMAEAGRVWEEKVLVRKWDKFVKKEKGPGGATRFGLWKGRLGFEMGRVGAFSVEAVRGEMVGKLRELGAELERDVGDGEQQGEVCEQVVYVFLRLTRLLGDAGFEELAVAAWQAVLEMVFCRPVEEGLSSAEAMVEAFGEFWESEIARVGEEGARGWRHFVEVGEGAVEPPEPRAEMPTDASKTADPFRAWAAAEQRRAERARMPARTLDEGTDDDPFRVVMFSDIKDLLVWFPSTVLPLAKALLVEAFLVFCGLPPTGISGERFAAMLKDPFVSGRGQGLDLVLNLDKNDAAATPDLSRLTPDFGQQGGGIAISPELLFSRDSWFRYLDKWSSTFQPGDTQVDVSWVLRTLGYLVKDCGVEDLAEYYLAMEWLNEPTGARKVAKGLLKKYSANTRLYNAYALLEWANNNPEVPQKVLSSATNLSLVSGRPAAAGHSLTLAVIYIQPWPAALEHLGVDPYRIRPAGDGPWPPVCVSRQRLPGLNRLPCSASQDQVSPL